ncbi:MAG: hypothetical protein QOI11_2864 [Candidatus Eremiobacteraeota bacterium]|jgi:hypothetical protein|nr:hypothetical protein [Candidatus Eremiobacteraeota bacterium]
MTNRALALVVFCAAAALPAAAWAADAPKPLRSLTYDLRLSAASNGIVERSAIGTAGSTHEDFTGGGESKGTITVDIIAATQDNGLVADVREDATNRTRPKVRVAITAAGALSYDPQQSHNITDEEDTLLRWLARGFVTADDRTAGAAWNIDTSAGGSRGMEHYRVLSADGAVLSLDYKAETKRSGLGGGDMTRTGSLVYDAKLTMPRSASYKDVEHRQQIGSFVTTELTVSLTLAADSFAAAK